jgi:membrane protein
MDRLIWIWGLLKKALVGWTDDHVSRLAAALAFYTVLSLAPLLVVAVAVAGFFFGEDAARGQMVPSKDAVARGHAHALPSSATGPAAAPP